MLELRFLHETFFPNYTRSSNSLDHRKRNFCPVHGMIFTARHIEKSACKTLRAQPWRWLIDSNRREMVRGEQVTNGIFLSHHEVLFYQIKEEQMVHLLLRCCTSVAVSNQS